MTRKLVCYQVKPAALAVVCLGFITGLPFISLAQTTPVVTNTITTVTTTTTVSTSASGTSTTTTTNVATATTLVPPPVKWDTSATFALTVTGGNTKTLLTTIDLQTQRKSLKNELFLDANGTYGENNDVKNAEQFDANGQYNRLATERIYYGLKVDGYHDAIAGIDYRLTVAPLAGYYFIKAPNTSLAAEVGPGYIYERDLGSDTTLSHASLRVGERFEHHINGTTKIWQDLEYLPQVQNFGDYYADGDIGINTSITKHAGLTSYIQDNYYSMPSNGRLHNDVKFVTGITYKF